ncbi:MAG TPA: Rne/Rng family ribonuclease [Nocardioidaceae bacterium]|nr:Rne/Rng family ribonuclease [Nocardioidaceae bacterium]
MLDDQNPQQDQSTPAGPPAQEQAPEGGTAKKTARKAAKTTAKKAPAKKAAKKAATKKSAARAASETADLEAPAAGAPEAASDAAPDAAEKAAKKTAKKATKKTAAKKTAKKTAKKSAGASEAGQPGSADESASGEAGAGQAGALAPVLFKAPETTPTPSKSAPQAAVQTGQSEGGESRRGDADETEDESGDESGGGSGRRRRRRGGRRRRKGSDGGPDSGGDDESSSSGDDSKSGKAGKDGNKDKDSKKDGQQAEDAKKSDGESGTGRRRRRRRRAGEEGDASPDDPEKTVTRVRKARAVEDEITALSGSTRLEAKKQRRREGREAGRRRAPIVSEAEFLARRESVERVMVIRQRDDLTQIAVIEDKVLVEHYVARESQTSLIGNVYLGKVQNVLPSMEAAFIDIGKGRNAVLYAGEVNWKTMGAGSHRDGPRKIEQVLKSGQSVLVQVTKDPIGHKGARLTSQISLPGRFLVYVPDGTTSGISRKLPDTERNRLKDLLKQIVPESAGVIVRTAAEGASEEELTRDVERLTARWNDIEAKVEKASKGGKNGAPQLLYGEPDLTLKVVRDLFTEDFAKLVVSGDDAWDMVDGYVEHVAPDLAERLEKYAGDDAFATYRIDEQIAKGLDRKVWLPSGGSLIVDRTEAMTVVDVNTGKFTGSGGNLEETVTKNNLEAAEEIVRQLRLRDIGGIIVVDFIDMVLESNRELVLRRLVECLGRDRTRHQVAEVTSLGLVQMTRKRIGTGLLEAFSDTCEHCQGRGVVVQLEPVEPTPQEEEPRRSRRGRNRGKSGKDDGGHAEPTPPAPPSPKDVAAMATPGKRAERERAEREQAEREESEQIEREESEQTEREEPEQAKREQAQGNQAEGDQAEPSAARAEPVEQDEAAAAASSSPRLVTTVRRRSVRAAGPPADAR